MKQIIKTYGSQTASQELYLAGKSVNKLLKLDDAFFTQYLNIKCLNLKTIYFENIDLTDTKINILRSFIQIESITFKWCLLNENFFSQTNNFFPKIKILHLIRSSILNEKDLECICIKMPNLTSLAINQCESSINSESIEIICRYLLNLKELDLINTSINDQAILKICTSEHLCLNLIRLNLSMSSLISNTALMSISESLINLKCLYLTSCFGISKIEYFVNLKHLNYLNINNTSIDKQKIKDYLLPLLPNCESKYYLHLFIVRNFILIFFNFKS